MNHDVFISYSSQDMEAAQAICHVLEQNEIRCWMAPRNIPPGSDYGDVIDEASPTIMTLPFIQYVLGIESESDFYDAISRLEHVTRYVRGSYYDRIKDKSRTLSKITFFHNSIENWLTNHVASGPFFVSKTEGTRKIANKFSQWLTDISEQNNGYWTDYGFGLQVLGNAKETIPAAFNKERLRSLVKAMSYTGALGGFTHEFNLGRQSSVAYCKALLLDGKEEDFLTFIIDLFELAKECHMEIDGNKFNGTQLFQAARETGNIGAILKFLFEKEVLCSVNTYSIIIRILRVLVYYDSCLCDPFDELPSPVFEDLQDFSTIELSRLTDELSRRMPSVECLSPLQRLVPEIVEENFKRITLLYYKALSERYPEKYPNSERYTMREITYQIGACTVRACE